MTTNNTKARPKRKKNQEILPTTRILRQFLNLPQTTSTQNKKQLYINFEYVLEEISQNIF